MSKLIKLTFSDDTKALINFETVLLVCRVKGENITKLLLTNVEGYSDIQVKETVEEIEEILSKAFTS